MENLVDIQVPAAPGSLMRAVQLWKNGRFRISRRHAEVYSVQITSAGAWARLSIFNGLGRLLFPMTSTFTGSFWLGAGAEDGIIVELLSMTNAPTVTVNFREQDTKLV
jgi:hypothetical protein